MRAPPHRGRGLLGRRWGARGWVGRPTGRLSPAWLPRCLRKGRDTRTPGGQSKENPFPWKPRGRSLTSTCHQLPPLGPEPRADHWGRRVHPGARAAGPHRPAPSWHLRGATGAQRRTCQLPTRLAWSSALPSPRALSCGGRAAARSVGPRPAGTGQAVPGLGRGRLPAAARDPRHRAPGARRRRAQAAAGSGQGRNRAPPPTARLALGRGGGAGRLPGLRACSSFPGRDPDTAGGWKKAADRTARNTLGWEGPPSVKHSLGRLQPVPAHREGAGAAAAAGGGACGGGPRPGGAGRDPRGGGSPPGVSSRIRSAGRGFPTSGAHGSEREAAAGGPKLCLREKYPAFADTPRALPIAQTAPQRR